MLQRRRRRFVVVERARAQRAAEVGGARGFRLPLLQFKGHGVSLLLELKGRWLAGCC